MNQQRIQREAIYERLVRHSDVDLLGQLIKMAKPVSPLNQRVVCELCRHDSGRFVTDSIQSTPYGSPTLLTYNIPRSLDILNHTLSVDCKYAVSSSLSKVSRHFIFE